MKIETTRTVRVETDGRVETWSAGERHEVEEGLGVALLDGGFAIDIAAAPAPLVVVSEPEPEEPAVVDDGEE